MDSRRAIERLEEHQSKISALLRSASGLLATDQFNSAAPLAALRWQLVRTLREYQLFKHHEIFDPLAASKDARLSSMAHVMKKRCLAIGDEYAAHVQRWSNGASTTTWHHYTSDTGEIINKLILHMSQEHANTSLALNGLDRTRQSIARTQC